MGTITLFGGMAAVGASVLRALSECGSPDNASNQSALQRHLSNRQLASQLAAKTQAA